MTALRVMTYNIRMLNDDRAAVLSVLRDCAPDVVAIQEPPRWGLLGRWRLGRLATEAGLVVVVAGRGARTTALLARPEIAVTGAHGLRLPSTPGRTLRGLAVADHAGLRIVSVHLGLSAHERSRQVLRIMPLVAAAPNCVVLGDLNELPDGPSWRRLGMNLRDLAAPAGPTYSATAPVKRIDAVLGSRGVTASVARVVTDDDTRRASDHLPVVVDIRWS